jgi:hypothetical protein
MWVTKNAYKHLVRKANRKYPLELSRRRLQEDDSKVDLIEIHCNGVDGSNSEGFIMNICIHPFCSFVRESVNILMM